MNMKVVLCKKTARKNTQYSRNKRILQIGRLAKAIAHAKALAFCKMSKRAKKVQKTILREEWSCSVRKTARKTLSVRELRQFSKSAILQKL